MCLQHTSEGRRAAALFSAVVGGWLDGVGWDGMGWGQMRRTFFVLALKGMNSGSGSKSLSGRLGSQHGLRFRVVRPTLRCHRGRSAQSSALRSCVIPSFALERVKAGGLHRGTCTYISTRGRRLQWSDGGGGGGGAAERLGI